MKLFAKAQSAAIIAKTRKLSELMQSGLQVCTGSRAFKWPTLFEKTTPQIAAWLASNLDCL